MRPVRNLKRILKNLKPTHREIVFFLKKIKLKVVLGEIDHSHSLIEQSLDESLVKMASVLRSLKNIELKTNDIEDIVFKTKLLSFNASVEAARAREAGKGFTVVTTEVGMLAESSQKASFEIKSIIQKGLEKLS
jgi:methyl-accepting chemotaxis protein